MTPIGLRPFAPASLVALVALATFGVGACDRPPSADSLKEWTPADHHSKDDDKLAQGAQQAAAPKAKTRPAQAASAPAQSAGAAAASGTAASVRASADDDVTQLVELTWRQQCAQCHGPSGRGDGQLGPMVRAPDLTREDWQSRVTDSEIAATIKNGKGKMPNFDVPQPVIDGLVARVRAARGH